MNKVFLSGASGFLGTHLYKFLKKKNFNIIAVGYKNCKKNIISCNILDKPKINLLLSDVECIVHCAGYSNTSDRLNKSEKKKIWDINYKSTKLLAKLAKKNRIKKFIYISSSKVIKENYEEKILENDKPNPKTEYAKSKHEAEKYLLKFGKKNNIKIICLRPTLVYGEGCKNNLKLIAKLTKLNLMPDLYPIRNKISLIHVNDLCSAIITVIIEKTHTQRIFTLSGPKDISLNQIIDFIKKSLNKKRVSIRLNQSFLKNLKKLLNIFRFISFFYKILLVIDKISLSSYYEAKKFNKIYKWKPKISPSVGFNEMLKNK